MAGGKLRVCVPASALIVMLAGCDTLPSYGSDRAGPSVVMEDEPEWRGLITREDEERVETIGQAWAVALDEARTAGFRSAVAREGALLDPAAALPWPTPPPGPYRCRVVKLGRQGPRRPAFSAYKPYFCYVEGDDQYLSITKQTGSERPAGWLYDDARPRLVFLGTLVRGNERETLAYGDDRERDMAGVVERVGPFRYRLVIPWPRHESKLDVIELVPVTE